MPTPKVIFTVGLALMLAALGGATARKWGAPPPEESARRELVKLQAQRYREWVPPEQ